MTGLEQGPAPERRGGDQLLPWQLWALVEALGGLRARVAEAQSELDVRAAEIVRLRGELEAARRRPDLGQVGAS